MSRLIDSVRRWGPSAIVVLLCASFPLSVYAAIQARDQANAKAQDAKQLALAINQERRYSIVRFCEQQNMRHRGTVRELRHLLEAAERVHPRQRARIHASQASTLLLIDQLAPLQNCQRLVRLEAKP